MTDFGARPLQAARLAYRGELPERYRGYPESFKAPFARAVGLVLAPGQDILDVGGGRTATITPEDRPPGCRFVGLDVSGAELVSAPPGSYDDIVVGDITDEVPDLKEQFDLILTFQALEHVEGLDRAFANMHTYLRPGGHLVAQFSGTFSFYGLLSRAIPDRPTRWLQHRLYGREPDTVFRAHYDKCYFRALERLLAPWDDVDITPLWMAEPYVHFSRILRSSYIFYEEWARERSLRDLAPYYLVVARR